MNAWVQNKVLNTISTVAGVTLTLLGKQGISMQLIIVEKRKGKLSIVEKHQGISSYDDLKAHIPKSCPVSINIEGTGVLVKKVDFNEDGSPKGQIVNNSDEFVLLAHNKHKTGFVSIIRKDLYKNIISELDQREIDIVTVRCNPFVLENLLPLVDLKGEHLFSNWIANINEGEVIGIKPYTGDNSENYKIGEDIIQSFYSLCYAECIAFFMSDYDSSNNNAYYLSEFTYKKLIVYVGWTVLATLLITLFANFIINDSYTKKYDIISGQYGKNKTLLDQLNLAEKELLKKENLIVKGGLTGTSDFAWYADKTVSIMPSKLVLTKIEINPLLKKTQPNREIKIENNLIIIEGESNETQYIHRWIELLKKELWVKEVEMTYYARKDLNEPAIFNLKLAFNVE